MINKNMIMTTNIDEFSGDTNRLGKCDQHCVGSS